MKMIEAAGLHKSYKRRYAVNGVNLQFKKGEIVGLLGPNGAGKTTTFYMITGIIRPDSGFVYYGDVNITKYPMYKRANLGIGYLAQEPSVFRNLTVEDNILAILQMKNMSKKEMKEKKDSLLEEFGITHIAKSFGYALSGGERRRVEIARTISIDPDFILLDEPFAGVDPIAIDDIQNIVSYLKEKDIGILITDHNVRETLRITDRAYIMAEGEILASGGAESIVNNERVKELYLGENFSL